MKKFKPVRLTCVSCGKKIKFEDAWRVMSTRKDYCLSCFYELAGLNRKEKKDE